MLYEAYFVRCMWNTTKVFTLQVIINKKGRPQ